MPEERKYRVEMLAHPRHPDIPAGWYGPVAGVTMNHHIYCRVPRKEDAFLLTAREAVSFVQGSKGWPCRCDPPIVITY